VTVTLAKHGLTLLSGATASVDVILGEATGALTVPTSAVSDGTVEVYADGKVSRVRVTTGLVGRSRTVMTSGLKAGQKVVLADMSAALPTSGAPTTTGRSRFGGGGFSGSFGGGGGIRIAGGDRFGG
jgi:HlyD family secretion protein